MKPLALVWVCIAFIFCVALSGCPKDENKGGGGNETDFNPRPETIQ